MKTFNARIKSIFLLLILLFGFFRANTCMEEVILIDEISLCVEHAPDGREETAMGLCFCVAEDSYDDAMSYRWYFENTTLKKHYKLGARDNTCDAAVTTEKTVREKDFAATDTYDTDITNVKKLVCVPLRI